MQTIMIPESSITRFVNDMLIPGTYPEYLYSDETMIPTKNFSYARDGGTMCTLRNNST